MAERWHAWTGEINETADIIVKTSVGETAEFTVKNSVKQGTTHGPVICCAETSKVNDGEETVEYIHGQVTIGIPVFMDGIMSAGGHADVTKTIKNCKEMEGTKKFTYGLKNKIGGVNRKGRH